MSMPVVAFVCFVLKPLSPGWFVVLSCCLFNPVCLNQLLKRGELSESAKRARPDVRERVHASRCERNERELSEN